MTHEDVSNIKFGRLTAISYLKGGNWICVCDCGNTKEVSLNHIKSGYVKSCGCLIKEGSHTTHSKSNTRIYRIWENMKNRCYNSSVKNYKNYGARKIIICDEWKNDFYTFYSWAIKNGYLDNLSIDRINVNGNYTPDNCKWSTRKEQSNNKTNSVFVSYEDKNITVSEASSILGISPYTIYSRIRKLKWSKEDSISIIPSYSNSRRLFK